MENQRTLLFAALAFISVLIWQAWQDDQQVEQVVASANINSTVENNKDIPEVRSSESSADIAEPTISSSVSTGQIIKVVTDVYSLEINTEGATINQLDLSQYPVEKGQPEVVNILHSESPKIYMVESGLISKDFKGPNHHTIWQTKQTNYTLSDDTLEVPLYWVGENGVKVTKTYTFHRDSYKVDVVTVVENNSSASVNVREYVQLKHNGFEEAKQNSMIMTYTGGVLYNEEEKYQKVDFDDFVEKENARDSDAGWLAIIQHYFVVAWIPEAGVDYHYYTKEINRRLFVIGAYSPEETINQGTSQTFTATLFAGPKIQQQLEDLNRGVELTVDFGILTILAEPIFWLLSLFYSWVANWGVAIILVTVTIKAMFYKLSEKSYKSMARMKLVQPRIVALKERYGDDKQQMNKAMMEMYKTEKINPLGGCLPILVQIPVFISLYWVLLESVELRQADFALWINNLSSPDPYFILPVIYGITMFLQQRLNPAPADPMQKKMMQLLPIMFTGFFAFFPSGLVLYWIVNNVLTIIQQTIITNKITAAEKK